MSPNETTSRPKLQASVESQSLFEKEPKPSFAGDRGTTRTAASATIRSRDQDACQRLARHVSACHETGRYDAELYRKPGLRRAAGLPFGRVNGVKSADAEAFIERARRGLITWPSWTCLASIGTVPEASSVG